MLTAEQGTVAVRAVRAAIAHRLGRGPAPKLEARGPFAEPSGVFVTLRRNGQLRGCIGQPYPDLPLRDALLDSATSAAFQDHRFPPLASEELDRVTMEVTVLTPPRSLECPPLRRAECVKVGRHGLIAAMGGQRGLLLPQVPVEQGWTRGQYLDHLCEKAGLFAGCWRDEEAVLYTFTAVVFGEE